MCEELDSMCARGVETLNVGWGYLYGPAHWSRMLILRAPGFCGVLASASEPPRYLDREAPNV